MPILVVCPGCKTEFRVSEKFAGKSGNCPKCKSPIVVPVVEEVKIAEPEPAVEEKKDKLGRPVSRPIAREKTELRAVPALIVAGVAVAVSAAAWFAGPMLRDNLILRALGLALVSPALAVAGYTFLRDADLEPHRGGQLWLRAAGCGLAYAALWGVFAALPAAWTPQEMWGWFFLAPPFLLVGGGLALAALDLDFGSGVLHYGFYLLATGALRWLAGMPALWAAAQAAS